MTHKKAPTLTETLEKNLEKKLEELTTHPYFLKTVSQAINLNSQRIVLTRTLFERALEALELPIRKNQEKILFQLDELKVQISFLENKISDLQRNNNEMNTVTTPLFNNTQSDEKTQKRSAQSKSDGKTKKTDSLHLL